MANIKKLFNKAGYNFDEIFDDKGIKISSVKKEYAILDSYLLIAQSDKLNVYEQLEVLIYYLEKNCIEQHTDFMDIDLFGDPGKDAQPGISNKPMTWSRYFHLNSKKETPTFIQVLRDLLVEFLSSKSMYYTCEQMENDEREVEALKRDIYVLNEIYVDHIIPALNASKKQKILSAKEIERLRCSANDNKVIGRNKASMYHTIFNKFFDQTNWTQPAPGQRKKMLITLLLANNGKLELIKDMRILQSYFQDDFKS